jgi:hypothetical protein
MITLKNFQGHEASSLDIQRPGINVLVGKSRAGKSAIVRAIEALCGQGPMYRRRGSKETRVEWDDCARIRSNTKNEFEVDGTVYKAMRSDTPKELQDRLRLSAINFRPQHQPYFLLADSPGAVAREMNKLTDLGVIDYVVGALKKSVKDTEAEVKVAAGNVTLLQKKVAGFDWAVAAAEDLKKIEDLQAEAVEIGTRVTALETVLTELDKIEDYLDFMPPTSTVWIDQLEARLSTTEMENLTRTVSEIEEVESWLASLPPDASQELVLVSGRVESAIDPGPLQRVCEELAELEYELALVPDISASVRELDAIMFPSGLSELAGMIEALEGLPDYSGLEGWELALWSVKNKTDLIDYLNEERVHLGGKIQMLTLYNTGIAGFNDQLGEAEFEFQKLMAEAGVCPLCMRGVE